MVRRSIVNHKSKIVNMLTFRPFNFSDEDYVTVQRLHDTVWTDNPLNMEGYRRWDSIRPKERYWNRVIAEKDGQPVAYGGFSESHWVDIPNTYNINFLTPPPARNQGICTAFYAYAMGKMAQDGHIPEILYADTREDKPDAIRWLTQNGFVQKDRYPRSDLKLADFDAAQFADYPKRITEHGLRILPLADIIPNDPQWQHKLYELEWIFEQDEPTPEPPKKIPFEEYAKGTLEDPQFTPAAWMLALDGDRFAGMSCLWPDKMKPHLLHTGWTGVDRPYRKKGLAMAMKLAAIEYAKQQPNITTIQTDNHETNWMYQINLRLGFKPLPAYLSYEKKL